MNSPENFPLAVELVGTSVKMLEQNLLPFEYKTVTLINYRETCEAIKTMVVRGAGTIGSAAAFAMAQAALLAPLSEYTEYIAKAKLEIEATRPTAQNLFASVNRVYEAAKNSAESAVNEAINVQKENIDASRKIAEFGNELIEDGYCIETHCNAGWLAFEDWGTALAPIYAAHFQGKNVFVYVDETRPRSQGARLTAWELQKAGIPHTIIPDNAGAFIMMQGKVNMMIVGADRIARNGDVANKIGTLEKAIAAHEFGVPFYVAAPTSTFDVKCLSGKDIPIEIRSAEEVLYQTGCDANGLISKVLVSSPGSSAYNPAFDVTPAKYITGIITEKGIIKPSLEEVCALLGENVSKQSKLF